MFWTRLRSGIILMIITITLMVIGGELLFYAIMLVSLIGLYELYRVVKMESSVPALIGYVSGICLDVSLKTDNDRFVVWVLVFAMMLFMASYVITFPKYKAEQITMLFFGLCYVTVMLAFVFKVRFVSDGAKLVWLIFVGAWGSDTCAYCVGKLIGKHKMPSKLSPNKTIEGCVGGVIGAALIGFLYALAITSGKTAMIWIAFPVIGAVSSVISQIGDLAASAIKRNYDIKDYGHLIPGHGGILDRFDSIIFTAPVVYFLTGVFEHLDSIFI